MILRSRRRTNKYFISDLKHRKLGWETSESRLPGCLYFMFIWFGIIWVSACRADPEAALQQQHGRAPLPLLISSRIRGVPASKQQGDSAVWQKQCACAAGNCLIPPFSQDAVLEMIPWVRTLVLAAVLEGRHGGRARLPLPAPERWHDDPEVDAKSAHEWLCRRLGLWAQVRQYPSANGLGLWRLCLCNLSNPAHICHPEHVILLLEDV